MLHNILFKKVLFKLRDIPKKKKKKKKKNPSFIDFQKKEDLTLHILWLECLYLLRSWTHISVCKIVD
jgi:hypothetical protein